MIIDDTYGYDGLRMYDHCPTLRSSRQGLKVMEPISVALRGRPYNGEYTTGPEFNTSGVANTLMKNTGLNMIIEPSGMGNEYHDTWSKGEPNGMRINSFFCGAGGFDLGFIQAGFEVEGAWDFDRYAVQSYRHNIGHCDQADVTTLKGADIPKANGWLFGFPCQDISVAGKQAGMVKGETRSGLFYEIMRLLDEVDVKPDWILAENVKAVSKLIPEIEKEYALRGYRLIPQLYNSKYWGVPQNRERYFLLGVREGVEFTFPKQIEQPVEISINDILDDNIPDDWFFKQERVVKMLETIRAEFTPSKNGIIQVNDPSFSQQRVYDPKGIAPTATAGNLGGGKEPCKIIIPAIPKLSSVLETEVDEKYYIPDEKAEKILEQARKKVELKTTHSCATVDRQSKTQNGRRAKDDEEDMFTLTAQDVHGVIEPTGCSFRTRTYAGQPQQIEVRKDSLSNTITTVNKDCMVLEASYSEEGIGTYNPKKVDGTQTYQHDRVYDTEGILPAVCSEMNGRTNILEQPEITVIGRAEGISGHDILKRVYDSEGLSPTLNTCGGGNQEVKILEQTAVVKDHDKLRHNTDGIATCCDASYFKGADNHGQRTLVLEQIASETGLLHENGVGKTIRVGGKGTPTKKHNFDTLLTPAYRVRKLTPREYARLQGFPEWYEQIVSNSQFYKQMGNAVTVPVSHAIAKAIAEQL